MSAQCPICAAEQHEGLVCNSCCTRLERDLGDVPAIVADLDVTISRQAKIGNAGKGGLASEKMPIHLGAVEAADVLTNTLTTWARDTYKAGESRWDMRFTPSLNPSVTAARVLLSNIDLIRRHPAAAELCDEIADAIKQARRVVDRPADRVYLGVCMYEDNDVTCVEELYASPTANEVRCKVCAVEHPVAERRAWLLKRAEDMLFTVREAAQMVGDIGNIRVTESAIRGYLHRKRLAYRPGTTTIRLGDLLAVVVDEGERRTA